MDKQVFNNYSKTKDIRKFNEQTLKQPIRILGSFQKESCFSTNKRGLKMIEEVISLDEGLKNEVVSETTPLKSTTEVVINIPHKIDTTISSITTLIEKKDFKEYKCVSSESTNPTDKREEKTFRDSTTTLVGHLFYYLMFLPFSFIFAFFYQLFWFLIIDFFIKSVVSFIKKRECNYNLLKTILFQVGVSIIIFLISSAISIKNSFQICGFDTNCLSPFPKFFSFLTLARFSGKIITSLLPLLIFPILRPIVNYFEEYKYQKTGNYYHWRFIHILFFMVLIPFAYTHIITHHLRFFTSKNSSWVDFTKNTTQEILFSNKTIEVKWNSLPNTKYLFLYEIWEIISGYLLFILFILISFHYSSIKLILGFFNYFEIEPEQNNVFLGNLKKWFRRSHYVLFIIIIIVLSFHAFIIIPFLLLVLHFLVYYKTRVQIKDIQMKFMYDGGTKTDYPPEGTSYTMVLTIQTSDEVLQKYGNYVVLYKGPVFASFSIIPLSKESFEIRIKKCSFSDILIQDLKTCHFLSCGMISLDKNYLSCYGFYNSFESNFGLKKKLLCFAKGTGSSVIDPILLHQIRNQPEKIVIFYESNESSYSSNSSVLEKSKPEIIKSHDISGMNGFEMNKKIVIFNTKSEVLKFMIEEQEVLTNHVIDDETDILVISRSVQDYIHGAFKKKKLEKYLKNLHIEEFNL